MAYNYPFPQPAVPGYFNANYMPPQPQMMQMAQQLQPQMQPQNNPMLLSVPDELTARNAQFPMDGSPAYFINANGQEIYSKQLSMANGSVIFRRFRREEEAKPEAPAYVTHDEMNAKLSELYQLIGDATSPAGGEAK